MNPMLREMSDKAQAFAVIHTKLDGPVTLDLYTEELARMIVNECCQKLENDGMVEAAIELKWHFGMDPVEKEITK